MMYRPSVLCPFLQELSSRPKKSLSQNFLIDANILRKIICTAEVTSQDTILEIGPGPGALTEALLNTGARVVAIEKDPVLAEALKRLGSEVINGDALDFSITDYFKGQKSVKVVANLPYHISSPLLAKLVRHFPTITSITVMVQKEMAERFIAKPNSSQYNSFALYLAYFSIPRYCFTVAPGCFLPRPRVHSAVVNLTLKPAPLPDDALFFVCVRTAFKQRRKMLRASLKELYPYRNIEACLQQLSLNPCARPQELSLEGFIALFNLLQ